MTLKAQVQTPMSKDDPTVVKAEEIPLPPPEQWHQLDNSAPRSATAKPVELATASPAARPIEKLDFRGKPTSQTIPLEFGFDHEELGAVDAITVSRLTVGAIGLILDDRPGDAPDLFDVYSAMTDVPAPVLRGLIDIDGERVTGACWDFLPRVFRPAPRPPTASSSTSETGGA